MGKKGSRVKARIDRRCVGRQGPLAWTDDLKPKAVCWEPLDEDGRGILWRTLAYAR